MGIKNSLPVKVGVKPYPCFGCPDLSFNEFRFEDGGVCRLPYCVNIEGCPDGRGRAEEVL